MKGHHIATILIIFTSFATRVWYICAFNEHNLDLRNDEIEYYWLGVHLCSGEGFVMVAGQPYAFRPPGYPIYLASLCLIFGPSIPISRISNAILDTLSCALIYRFVKRMVSTTAAILAGLIFAFHPILIYFSGFIYPETFSIFLISVLIFVLLSLKKRPWLRGMLAGLIVGYMIHIRPNWVLLVPSIILWFLIHSNIKDKKISICAILVLFIISIVPWTVRNYLRFNEIILVSTNGGATFWGGNNPLARGGWVEPSPSTWKEEDPPVDLRGWPGLTEKESEARFYAAAFRWIRNHPIDFLLLLPKKLQRALSLNFGNQYRQADMPILFVAIYYVYLAVALIGFILSIYEWRRYILLYNLVFLTIITTLLFYGSTRQSMPMIIPTIVFVSIAIPRMMDQLISFRRIVLRH